MLWGGGLRRERSEPRGLRVEGQMCLSPLQREEEYYSSISEHPLNGSANQEINIIGLIVLSGDWQAVWAFQAE